MKVNNCITVYKKNQPALTMCKMCDNATNSIGQLNHAVSCQENNGSISEVGNIMDGSDCDKQ